VGEFIEMYPDKISRLKEWTKSENRWMKRASAVTFIIPARKGKFLTDIIEIANNLLTDKDDLVQKGYGWMLKAAGQAYPNEIFNYVMSKQSVMPRTAFRYAIEKLPAEMKKQAMGK
jgi:3-methyladenine DNA glycosylase AlkD